ncbi:antibiotic biosynthesis monooxygenase [uncultured Oxalicibacterium sp.]|uniref:putative quinol monooxygenase n=1 Tax=uncultured Oxalicibacterium sp. TaxID=1168540 RepID=UPI0025FE8BC4|nr:antibiotic biosynthesis monooxygenase [uncultured Oxalicibacterium sp.]
MVTLGLQARLEAKPGKEMELEEFLHAQLSYAIGEPATVAWFAVKLAPGVFGIFDAFADESGRKAHLEGEIAKALQGDVGKNLLAKPPTIESFQVLAAKLPGNGEIPDSLG